MKQEAIDYLLENNILISPDAKKKPLTLEEAEELLSMYEGNLDLLDEGVIALFKQRKKSQERSLEIIKSYEEKGKDRTYTDFVTLFNTRFDNLRTLLRNRNQIDGLSSINRLSNKTKGENISVIGMIRSKRETSNGNLLFDIEDKTGKTRLIVKDSDEYKDIFNQARDIQLDEIIAVQGVWLTGAIFANDLIFPDIPRGRPLKKHPEEQWAAFLGDPHFGSNVFLQKEYNRFIKWLKGNLGTKEQRSIAKKVKYVICPGDLIEGAGIYPGQEKDLEYEDVKKQYQVSAEQLKKIPDHIEIVVIPGNHDVGRLAEPQHTIPKSYAEELYNIENLQLASNPAMVRIGKTENFPGFNVLLYHGGSLIYYSQNIPSVRDKGGQKRPDLMMKYMLQRRHLSPTHGATPYVPDKTDPLFIDEIPDIFVTGHIHRASIAQYRGITMINASTWTATTEDQIKRGLEPQPGRVPLLNLQTRQGKMMNFLTKQTKQEEAEKQQKVKEDVEE